MSPSARWVASTRPGSTSVGCDRRAQGPKRGSVASRVIASVEALDDPNDVLAAIAMLTREGQQIPRPLQNRTALGGSGNADPAPAAKVEQAFLAKLAERAQHSVRVDPDDRRQIFGWRQPLPGFGFAVHNGATDLGRDLLMQLHVLAALHLDS